MLERLPLIKQLMQSTSKNDFGKNAFELGGGGEETTAKCQTDV